MPKRSLTIAPRDDFKPGIGRFVAMMEDVRTRTKKYCQSLTAEQLSWHPCEKVESIGTLLLHIAAAECSYIREDIARKPMGEEWKIAFPIRFGMKQIEGRELEYYINKLNEVRKESFRTLAGLTDDDLLRVVSPLDSGESDVDIEYTIEWLLYHLVEHEAHHKGQIAVMKRLLPI